MIHAKLFAAVEFQSINIRDYHTMSNAGDTRLVRLLRLGLLVKSGAAAVVAAAASEELEKGGMTTPS